MAEAHTFLLIELSYSQKAPLASFDTVTVVFSVVHEHVDVSGGMEKKKILVNR